MAGLQDKKLQAAEREVQNGLRQYDLGIEIIRSFTEERRPFLIFPGVIRQLQKIAVQDVEPNPGEWRTASVQITESRHAPPEPHLVPGLVQEMCDYVNNNWHECTAFHLSAYVMWRHNWIHPFSDGNGRTSRMLSYIILSIKLGYLLPGFPTIPQQIQNDRTQYFNALEEADGKYQEYCSKRVGLDGGVDENYKPDVSAMETLLKNMLGNQLLSVIEQANGGPLRETAV
ncbi:Fic family protein [Pararhodospirillum oryzae]|uniref:Fic family protein n=1 Tax=Pararhodospirillum oryzae TaxID=478448 RepID=UPI001C3F55CC|nr:Fic family protein [Pararhodospirillum oryzae]